MVTFWRAYQNEHFSAENGALRWSILAGKQKHNATKAYFKHEHTHNRQQRVSYIHV